MALDKAQRVLPPAMQADQHACSQRRTLDRTAQRGWGQPLSFSYKWIREMRLHPGSAFRSLSSITLRNTSGRNDSRPVQRGLVASPELWRSSSFRAYAFGEIGPVAVNKRDVLKMRIRAPAA